MSSVFGIRQLIMTTLSFSCPRPKLRLSCKRFPGMCKALNSSPSITIAPPNPNTEGNTDYPGVKGTGCVSGDTPSECLACLGKTSDSLFPIPFAVVAGITGLVQGGAKLLLAVVREQKTMAPLCS